MDRIKIQAPPELISSSSNQCDVENDSAGMTSYDPESTEGPDSPDIEFNNNQSTNNQSIESEKENVTRQYGTKII